MHVEQNGQQQGVQAATAGQGEGQGQQAGQQQPAQGQGQQQAQAQGNDGGSDRVPVAELQSERRKRQALEAELAKLRAANLTEEQRLKAIADEYEKRKPELEAYQRRAERQRDELLKALPKDRRSRLEPTLERLSLADQIEILEAAIPPPSVSNPSPSVNRDPPVRPQDAGAPRTYSEWLKLPPDQQTKYRDLAATLPD